MCVYVGSHECCQPWRLLLLLLMLVISAPTVSPVHALKETVRMCPYVKKEEVSDLFSLNKRKQESRTSAAARIKWPLHLICQLCIRIVQLVAEEPSACTGVTGRTIDKGWIGNYFERSGCGLLTRDWRRPWTTSDEFADDSAKIKTGYIPKKSFEIYR